MRCTEPDPVAVDFSNTHVVTLRRHEPAFARSMEAFDFFVPDGMPLVWIMNGQGAGMKNRVYGPTFMRHALAVSPPEIKHYFLGGSPHCLDELRRRARELNTNLNIVGYHHGYFKPDEEETIVADIRRSGAEFIWIGLGTPKQQEWIHRHKKQFTRGILLAVGFAFDVNAGTKKDAPQLLQRLGLTWVYRIAHEPKRLFPRYLKYNMLFLSYLIRSWF